jgi:hypothetical protein
MRIENGAAGRRSARPATLIKFFCCRGSRVGCNPCIPQAARLPLQEEFDARISSMRQHVRPFNF